LDWSLIKAPEKTWDQLDAQREEVSTVRGTLSTSEVARLLRVCVGSVVNWIDRGHLKAGRTPGGHRRITVKDLIKFLTRHKMPIPAELSAGARKILVVADEPAATGLLADEIEARFPNCEVLEAHDGFSAGEIIGSTKPPVVIMDLHMSDIDGFEICRRLKSRDNPDDTKDTVVIAMTSRPTKEAEERILDCGAKICLPKPVDIPNLLAEVGQALGETA
jgi:excisionase family DNA binding protein